MIDSDENVWLDIFGHAICILWYIYVSEITFYLFDTLFLNFFGVICV